MSGIFNFPSLIGDHNIDLSQYSMREKIELIEWAMFQMDGHVTELPTTHKVFGGMYVRELTIPEGFVLTGKIHLEDHFCILTKGDLSVMTDEGMKRIQAPCTFEAKAGIKKIGFAHDDVIFATIHKTDLTDIEEIEKALFVDSDLTWIDKLMVAICQQ
jgi:hypothetical protein